MNKENIKECIICYETIQHIQFNCGHKICINCYCKCNLNIDNCTHIPTYDSDNDYDSD